jgi:transcriptional antiterminator RfaH
MTVWYAVHTHAREENKALFNLQRQGYGAYLPQYLKMRSHARRIEQVPAPLFPRYLFVLVDKARQNLSAIRSTFGVSHLVSIGAEPLPVPSHIISGIKARENDKGFVAFNDAAGFVRGDVVRIVDGPMSDQSVIFDCLVDSERVQVLLDLLGRQIRARLPRYAVAAP